MCPRIERPITETEKARCIGAYMFFQAGFQMSDDELDLACKGAMYMQEMKKLRKGAGKQEPSKQRSTE